MTIILLTLSTDWQMPDHVGKAAFWPSHIRWLLLILSLLIGLTGQAQTNIVHQTGQINPDSSQGYWRLNTQAATNSTVVQFYGPTHQLLYEEIMPGRWVNLTRKNQKRFDQLLAQLVTGQLLASSIKTSSLPPLPEKSPPFTQTKSIDNRSYVLEAASYLVNGYISQNGKLYLVVDNPERLRYKVSVVDQKGLTVYEEFTNHNRYRRRLDLADLPEHSYQVCVIIAGKQYHYKVKRQSVQTAYSMQLQAFDEPNLAKSKLSFIPTSTGL